MQNGKLYWTMQDEQSGKRRLVPSGNGNHDSLDSLSSTYYPAVTGRHNLTVGG